MRSGFPKYGIGCHKFATNFGNESRTEGGPVFCGIKVNTSPGGKFSHLSPDVTPYFKQNIAYSINFKNLTPSSVDEFLVKRAKFLPKIKMQTAFLDESVNGRERTLANLFVINYVNVLRYQ